MEIYTITLSFRNEGLEIIKGIEAKRKAKGIKQWAVYLAGAEKLGLYTNNGEDKNGSNLAKE